MAYDFELADKIVAGIEGDLVWNDQQYFILGSGGVATVNIDMDGSLRSRLGFDLDGVMPYAAAGVAFAHANVSVPGATFSATHAGWTVGAGVEARLTDKISANLEYRYSDPGTQIYDNGPLSLTNNTFRMALNYHF